MTKRKMIDAIKKLNETLPEYTGNVGWMGRDASLAFVIALGAGPWKLKRRIEVQREAIELYKAQRISDLVFIHKKLYLYPLEWQNNFFNNLVYNLKNQGLTFYVYISNNFAFSSDKDRIHSLHEMCGVARTSKVLTMFFRDYIELKTFPIDRHVKRILVKNKLPVNCEKMVELCDASGVDCNDLNRRMFGGNNYDWSEHV